MLTKSGILEESKYFLGKGNKLLKEKQPLRRDLIDILVKDRLFSSFEERACLKRELKRRKIKFPNDASQYELVQIALDKGLDFKEFIL
tara:strand:- start:874 stop:1137 length:264 start_codon:yes stop_codon:yes gene_type:complete